MMDDLGRRYFLFVGTARGKQISVGVLVGLAAVIDIAAVMLSWNGHRSPAVRTLDTLGAGLLAAAGISMFMNRRAT
jgi:hypothetical protein